MSGDRTGWPEVDALLERQEAERAAMAAHLVVTDAEAAVRAARCRELAAMDAAAHLRAGLAEDLLTEACRDGDPARIAAASRRVEEAREEADAVGRTVRAGLYRLAMAASDEAGTTRAIRRRIDEADAAVLVAIDRKRKKAVQ